MLLTEMPARPDAPEPKRAIGQSPRYAIAFDQAIRTRMEELGWDEAELTNKYCDILRLQGDHKAKPDNRRKSITELLNTGSNPTTRTLFAILHPSILNGELMVCWGDNKFLPISDRQGLAQVVKERLAELKLSPYELARRYCHLKASETGTDFSLSPSNHLKVVTQMMEVQTRPRLQTVTRVISALDGQMLIQWRNIVRETIRTPNAAYRLLGNLASNQAFVVEYYQVGETQKLN